MSAKRCIYTLSTGAILDWRDDSARWPNLIADRGVGRSETATGTEANISDVADLEVIETNPAE